MYRYGTYKKDAQNFAIVYLKMKIKKRKFLFYDYEKEAAANA